VSFLPVYLVGLGSQAHCHQGAVQKDLPEQAFGSPLRSKEKEDEEKAISTLYPRAFLRTDKITQPKKTTVKRGVVNKTH